MSIFVVESVCKKRRLQKVPPGGMGLLGRIGMLCLTAGLLFAGCRSLGVEEARGPDYLGVVRSYADALLTHGRDVYGAEHTPLLAATLDRETMTLFEGEALERIRDIPRENWGIRSHDRILTGANPMHDQNLYQVLYALADLTGEARYAREADRTLAWFFRNTQSPQTGLLAWGEHMGWDFRTEAVVEKPSGTTHEYFRPWVLWQRAQRLAPEAFQRFAYGVWRHQVADHERGRFSRHADYDRHDPDTGAEFPRHGGFYIATWAEAYDRTRDPVFLEAIDTVLGYFEGRRSPSSGAIPAEDAPRSKGELMWPGSNLSLAIDLWASADLVPDTLARKMRRSAAQSDAIFLSLAHELGPEGAGFVKAAHTHTLTPGDVRGPEHRPHTRMWATGYGEATDAGFANLALVRFRQTGHEGYRRLALQAAERYLTSDLDLSFPVYPGTLGDVILLLVGAHEVTGEDAYLARADHFGRQALALFFDETSPLPRASSHHDHYEAITRGDTLMMALLRLWTAQHRPDTDLPLAYTDR